MTASKLAVVVLAAGKGTRMKSALPKVLHPVAGRPMIAHVLDTLSALAPTELVAVVAPGMEAVAKTVTDLVPGPTPRARCVVQDPPLGTGHAVMAASAALADFRAPGDSVLVAIGDAPLIRAETLAGLVAARAAPPHPELVVLGFRPADPTGYGRVLSDADGRVTAIVEHRDASAAEREVRLCNGGLILIDAARLPGLLERIGNDNAKGEYYLTDAIGLAVEDGLTVGVREAPETEIMGVDDKAKLARAEAAMQDRLRAAAMAAGVTLVDPASVWLAADTRLAADVTIEPNVFLGPGVSLGEGATIRAFSHLEETEVGAGASIGPFARLRGGSVIGPKVKIGNFVETKKTVMGEGAKASHLTYLGDSEVGAGANVGAGTITCNYDGFAKHRTEIGAGAFIGSNTALVAPVTVGEGAIVGAGSTITADVPDQALGLTRAPQIVRERAAARIRDSKRQDKSKAS